MEYCDIYDREGRPTGECLPRECPLGENRYRKAVDIWIVGPDGRLLIQQRSPNKKSMPNIWAIHGGAVQAGETPIEAAVRECREEIGIRLRPESLKFLSCLVGDGFLWENYLVRQDYDVEHAVLQKEEVSRVRWATFDEVTKMIAEGTFFAYEEYDQVRRAIEGDTARREAHL